MSNISVGQIIMDAQRVASRVKDLDAFGSALLVEAEGNNRLMESLRQYQDDVDSLNRITNNKSNAEMVNRIQQQNANSSEIMKENRELKVCIEDYERAMELMMQKYREHVTSTVLENKFNFKDAYNERLWLIIREQREKINEMAAVMHRAASMDDDAMKTELETVSSLRLENNTLRELLEISRRFGNTTGGRSNEQFYEDKGVQTEADDSADELSISGASVENALNNTVIMVNNNSNANHFETDDIKETTIIKNTAIDVVAAKANNNNTQQLDINNGPTDATNESSTKSIVTALNSDERTKSIISSPDKISKKAAIINDGESSLSEDASVITAASTSATKTTATTTPTVKGASVSASLSNDVSKAAAAVNSSAT